MLIFLSLGNDRSFPMLILTRQNRALTPTRCRQMALHRRKIFTASPPLCRSKGKDPTTRTMTRYEVWSIFFVNNIAVVKSISELKQPKKLLKYSVVLLFIFAIFSYSGWLQLSRLCDCLRYCKREKTGNVWSLRFHLAFGMCVHLSNNCKFQIIHLTGIVTI